LFILIFSCLCIDDAFSQWTEEDSLWLDDILVNNKEVQLKPEVLKAIESGNLINIDHYNRESMTIESYWRSNYMILKDFSHYIRASDPIIPSIDYSNMLPCVFVLYFNEPYNIQEDLKSFSLVGIENYAIEPPRSPLVVTDPLMKGQASGGVRFMFNINAIINYYFIKE